MKLMDKTTTKNKNNKIKNSMGTSPFYFTALAHIGSKIEQSNSLI